jgi:hypothetical protein
LLISTLQITPHWVFSVYFELSLLGNSSQQWLFLCSVFTRRFLATNLNNGDTSAPVVTPLLYGEFPATELSTPSSQISTNCSLGTPELDWLILRLSLSRPVCLGIKQTSGAYDQIFISVRQLPTSFANKRRQLGRYSSLADYKPRSLVFFLDSYGFVDMGRSLWREDGSVVYNSCRPSPAKSFSGASPLGLATIFYYLKSKSKSHCDWRSVNQ